MSDFINQIRQSARTPEEVEAEKEAYHKNRENEMLTKSLNKFCQHVKWHIADRAKQGKYEVIDGEKIIKGYLWYPLCESSLWHDNFYNHWERKGCQKSWSLHHPKYNDNSYTSRDTTEYKSCLHYFKIACLTNRVRWSMTNTLTPLVTENFPRAQKILQEDDIKISHIWIVTKWNQRKIKYAIESTKGDKLISREVFYTDEITVTQSYREHAEIEFAYEYEVRF